MFENISNSIKSIFVNNKQQSSQKKISQKSSEVKKTISLEKNKKENVSLKKTTENKILIPNEIKNKKIEEKIKTKVIMATQDDLNKIIERTKKPGSVLTALGGNIEISQEQRKYIALINEPRWIVISKSQQYHYDVSSVKSMLKRKGIYWNTEFLVDMDTIREIYERTTVEKKISTIENNAYFQQKFMSIVNKASERNASDIHIRIKKDIATLEWRIDGDKEKFDEMTASDAHRLLKAAYALTDAQDGTYSEYEYQGARITEDSLDSNGLKFENDVQSLRLQFNVIPSGGRYLVARLLYAKKIVGIQDVDTLGYAPSQIYQIKQMRRHHEGINIISGPTGSGKSTTLQISLTALLREQTKINCLTIEDPPEYVIEEASQFPVTGAKDQKERGEKFRIAINAALRSDPDVIMIGEIRDAAAANLAIEAAQTGHSVWASLHANNAISILSRLRDIGVDLYNLCDHTLFTGLIGQRLVKKINLENCLSFEEGIKKNLIDKKTIDLIIKIAGNKAQNINFANTTLEEQYNIYKGRTVVAETICPDQNFLDLFKEGKKFEASEYWINELEGITMLEHAFYNLCSGNLDIRDLESKVGMIEKINPNRIETIFKTININN